jgi:hypothetical protein
MLLNKRILIESTVKQNGYFLLVPNEDVEQSEISFEENKDDVPY